MTLTLSTYSVILPLIFAAGFIDSIAGGGGLISLPAYLVAGLPPHTALANNKFSSVFGTLLSTIRYFKHGFIDIRVAFVSSIFALCGSYWGTKTVIKMTPFFLNYVLLILLPTITIFTLVKKEIGQQNFSHRLSWGNKIIIASLMGLIIGFYDGFFGPGTGTFLIFGFTLLLKYDFLTANGNTKVVNLASNIASVTTFLAQGKVILLLGIPAAFAGIAGNYFGSRYVIQKGNKLIRIIYLSVFIMLLIKILWDVIQN